MIVACRDGTARKFGIVTTDNEGPESPLAITFKCEVCGVKIRSQRPSDSFDKLFGHRCDDD